MIPWLAVKLAGPGSVDEDVHYALGELLSLEEQLSEAELNRRIDRVKTRFAGSDGTKWSEELRRDANGATNLLKVLALG